MITLTHKIDFCDVCKENKAEYFFYKSGFFVTKWKHVCKKCLKVIDSL